MSPRTPLFHPKEYFERNDRPSLSLAAIVVIANAVLSSVFFWWFFADLFEELNIPPGAASEILGMISDTVIGLFFSVLIGWFLLSVVLHVVVWLASGERGFGTTVAVVGIADLVSLAVFPLTIVGFFLWLGDVPANPTVEQSVEYLQTVASGTSPFLSLLILITGLWKAYLHAVGLSRLHDIPFEKIAVVTFVLAILGVIVNLV